MLRYIVLVSSKPEVSADQIEAWREAVADMCETRADVLSFSIGRNIGSGPNHHDAALVADFEGIDAFRRFVGSDGSVAQIG